MDEGDMGLDDCFHYIRLECRRLSHPDRSSDDDCPSCCQPPCAKCKGECHVTQVAMDTGVG